MFILRRRLFAIVGAAALILGGTTFAQSQTDQELQDTLNNDDQTPDNDDQTPDIRKVSEAFGHFIGRNLNSPGIKFDLESIIKGMRNGAAGNPAPMKEEDYEKAMAALQEKAFSFLAEENLRAANEFLLKNVKAEGVIEIEPRKLQYIILQQGSGPAISEHGTPLVNYTGKYLDGTVFGSSAEVGGPIPVPLDQTIPGFSKGIVGMKEGEKRRLFVHPDLGYGKSGQLPPNTLLIFEVEAVKAASPEKAPQESSTSNKFGHHDDDKDDTNDDDSDDDHNR